MCAHVHDYLYRIWSKLEYGRPACISWLYKAAYSSSLYSFLLSGMAGNFRGVLIFVIFVVDL